MRSLWAGVTLAALVGCAFEEENRERRPDAGEKPNTCTILEAEYGDLGMITGDAEYKPAFDDDPQGPKVLSIQVPLNSDAEPDILFIELFEDSDLFTPDLRTGEFVLLDMQTDVIFCSACVYIGADFTDPDNIDFHMARSGTLTIDSLDLTPDTGSVTGTLSNINLRAVILGDSQADVECGCETRVTSLDFDFRITVPPAAQSRPPLSPRTRLRARAQRL